jgi:alpha-D-ribose 1-methylphosphonate 5-triphosphate diphosphatase
MTDELVLTNARIVTAEEVVDGTMVVRDGRIAELAPGRSTAGEVVDLGGDWLLPGLVELHTDNLERAFSPRLGVRWPADAAMLTHDAQIAAAGITTVGDAVCVGYYGGKSERLDYLSLSIEVLHRAQAARALKADHFLHLRLEIADPHMFELFEPLMAEPSLRLISFMDHTPGQRQYRNVDRFRAIHAGRSAAEIEALIERRMDQQLKHAQSQRDAVLRLIADHPAVRASHDDTTPEHVAEAVACGCRIAEFPTTVEAAEALHAAGIRVLMGAPNLVRGGSHSGNVASRDLAAAGLLDILSSDYVPSSLLMAALALPMQVRAINLAAAIRTVTKTPAEAVGLNDRGEIAPGKRADVLRVHVVDGVPAVRATWRSGRRVA